MRKIFSILIIFGLVTLLTANIYENEYNKATPAPQSNNYYGYQGPPSGRKLPPPKEIEATTEEPTEAPTEEPENEGDEGPKEGPDAGPEEGGGEKDDEDDLENDPAPAIGCWNCRDGWSCWKGTCYENCAGQWGGCGKGWKCYHNSCLKKCGNGWGGCSSGYNCRGNICQDW
uniref:Uncharacterized protein n=1 Tax=Meloidogyne javanica TaxID=6303 RepID=A0A915MKC2_MELJA